MKVLPKSKKEWQSMLLFVLVFPFMAFCLPPLVSKLALRFSDPRVYILRAIESEISDTFTRILFWPWLLMGLALLAVGLVSLYRHREIAGATIGDLMKKPLLRGALFLLAGVLCLLALIIISNLATHALWGADKAMVGTIREHLPQYVPQFQFACVRQETWDRLSTPQQEAAREILSQEFGTLYIGTHNIPPEKWG